MKKDEKEKIVEEMRHELTSATGIILAEFRGLEVAKSVGLRKKLRESGVSYRVVKNTLTHLAIRGTDKEFLAAHLAGPTAVAWSNSDPVAAAKILVQFAKDNSQLRLKAGYLTGSSIDVDGIKALAELPGRDELRAKFLSVFRGPTQKMVTLLTQVPRNFLLVLKQRQEQLTNA
ncbi:MAG: 50S ribosomal protein L10 [Myxococcales bacterium]|nr:50S ribosomal protein L10 [Myxococcales bacterium]